jgi:hypothetical protein
MSRFDEARVTNDEMPLENMVAITREGIAEVEQARGDSLNYGERRILVMDKTDWDDSTIDEVLEVIDYEDAEKWRALLRCGRIRMFGSANVDTKTGEVQNRDDWVHFGAEFWSHYPQGSLAENPENKDDPKRWGNLALMALVDQILYREDQERKNNG